MQCRLRVEDRKRVADRLDLIIRRFHIERAAGKRVGVVRMQQKPRGGAAGKRKLSALLRSRKQDRVRDVAGFDPL